MGLKILIKNFQDKNLSIKGQGGLLRRFLAARLVCFVTYVKLRSLGIKTMLFLKE